MAGKVDPKTGVTDKQDKFAQLVITEGCLSTAYRKSYSVKNYKPESVWTNACKLAADAKVSQRIEYWREKAARKHEVTVESLTKYLNKAIEISDQDRIPSGIVAAVKELGVLHGVRVEKTDNKTAVTGNLEVNQDAALNAMKRKHATKPK